MKTLIFSMIAIALIAVGQASAQTGTIKGTITIKQMSGNNLGNFNCSNLKIQVSGLSKLGWKVFGEATGDISTRRCNYSVPGVRAGDSFVVGLSAEFPKACDSKTFKPDNSFPMKVRYRQTVTYNPSIYEITCTLVK